MGHKWMDAVGVRDTGEKRERPEGSTEEPAKAKAKARAKREGKEKPAKEKPAKAEGPREAPKRDPSGENLNPALAAVFADLSSFEFKRKEKFKGIAYKKVAKILSDFDVKVTSAQQVDNIKGIGPASLKKIAEFLENGAVERLERYRRGDMDGGDD